MSFLPKSDAALLEWSNNFSAKLQDAAASFYVTEAQALEIKTAVTAYADAYAVAKDPATRTKMAVAEKNLRRQDVREICGGYGRMIEANPKILDPQRIDLGLTVRKPPTPAPIPGVAAVEVARVVGNIVDVIVHGLGDSKRAKPEGVDSIGVFAYVGDEAPLEFSKWMLMGMSGRPKARVEFPATLAPGTRVYLTACYFNTRKEQGLLCTPVPVNLQGGAVESMPTAMKLAA